MTSPATWASARSSGRAISSTPRSRSLRERVRARHTPKTGSTTLKLKEPVTVKAGDTVFGPGIATETCVDADVENDKTITLDKPTFEALPKDSDIQFWSAAGLKAMDELRGRGR